jgi:hypothetical protein
MRGLIGLVLVSLPIAGRLAGQSTTPGDSLLDRLTGSWVLEGEIAGQQTTHDVSATWVLNHGYVELHEVSRERAATGAPEYEAIVYLVWDQPTRQYAVLWLDNTAAGPFDPQGVGHAAAAGDSIPFVFRNGNVESFRNTFVYDRNADTWQWHMDNVASGVFKPFARVTLRRR